MFAKFASFFLQTFVIIEYKMATLKLALDLRAESCKIEQSYINTTVNSFTLTDLLCVSLYLFYY